MLLINKLQIIDISKCHVLIKYFKTLILIKSIKVIKIILEKIKQMKTVNSNDNISKPNNTMYGDQTGLKSMILSSLLSHRMFLLETCVFCEAGKNSRIQSHWKADQVTNGGMKSLLPHCYLIPQKAKLSVYTTSINVMCLVLINSFYHIQNNLYKNC